MGYSTAHWLGQVHGAAGECGTSTGTEATHHCPWRRTRTKGRLYRVPRKLLAASCPAACWANWRARL